MEDLTPGNFFCMFVPCLTTCCAYSLGIHLIHITLCILLYSIFYQSTMVQCTGCHELFTTKGYQTHICLTTNHNCAAIYTQGLLYISSDSGSESSDDESNGGDSGDLYEPAAFPGGFFGKNYSRADFEGLESDSEGDEADEDVVNAMHKGGWEPEPPKQPLPDNADDIVVDKEEVLGGEERQRRIENHLQQKPHVVKLPGGHAGAPMPNSQALGGPEEYKSKLGNNAQKNPWAPFSLQIDWEIAKWAKTRGPGSTAFTELLDIEGASPFNLLLYCLFNLIHRPKTHLGFHTKTQCNSTRRLMSNYLVAPTSDTVKLLSMGRCLNCIHTTSLSAYKLYGEIQISHPI
jgi:hypothetical protein